MNAIVKSLKRLKNANKWIRNLYRIKKLRALGASIGKNVVIGDKYIVDNPKGLCIGDNVYIGNGLYANCIGKITIGDGTIISNNCTFVSFNHDYKDSVLMPYGLGDINKEIIIGKQVWIGINCNVAAGAQIEDQSIIGMGTTVARKITESTIYAGGRQIGSRPLNRNAIDLLCVRSIYNPFHYIMFLSKIKKLCTSPDKIYKVSLSDIMACYKYDDVFNMLYVFYNENNLDKSDLISKLKTVGRRNN